MRIREGTRVCAWVGGVEVGKPYLFKIFSKLHGPIQIQFFVESCHAYGVVAVSHTCGNLSRFVGKL